MIHAIGIDVGGTATRVGIVSNAGVVASDSTLVAVEHFQTGSDFATLQQSIADGVASVFRRSGLSQSQALPVGLAIPGLIDGATGRVRRCVNLPFLEGRKTVDLLPEKLRADAYVLSDAEAATWGEYFARDNLPKRFAHLRLGTGVACGVIVDGTMVELKRPVDQHADVLVFDKSADAPLCKCGRRGCLEAIASRGALCDSSRMRGAGDSQAKKLVEGVACAIAVVARRLAGEYGVEVVALGGGVVAEWPGLMECVPGRIGNAGTVRVVGALLGDDAGVVGAAIHALRQR